MILHPRAAMGLVLVCAATAQTTPAVLKLEDCIRLALAAPSPVAAARQQAEIARLGVMQAKAGFMPQASLGNTHTYNSPNRGEISFVALNGVREYSSLGQIGVDLDTSGRLRAQLARARADQNVAGASLRLSERDLKRLVTASYYRAVLARRLVAVARDSLAEAQSFEKRTRLLAAGGEAAQADVVKAAAETAFLEQAVNVAELEAQIAIHDLVSYWTTDMDSAVTLADTLEGAVPLPEIPTPAGTPYRGRVEFNLLEAQKQGFLADARRARADLYPQLSWMGQYGVDSLRFSMRDRGYASFLHLNVPIFDFFRARNAAKQSEFQALQVENQRQISERAFARDYRDALSRVDLIYSQIALADHQVKLSADNLKLSRLRYEGGEGAALDVVSAQSQLTQARTNYYTAKANYLNARTDLEVAAGR